MNAGCRLGWHPSNHYAELNLAKFSRETSNPPRELLFSRGYLLQLVIKFRESNNFNAFTELALFRGDSLQGGLELVDDLPMPSQVWHGILQYERL